MTHDKYITYIFDLHMESRGIFLHRISTNLFTCMKLTDDKV